ncbi:hypothetical protein [Chryseobacterium sp. 'Rf worker isolate 10']|uniref:hypothetical protein n=1 Tax=Chryseobacterium sp. 'Rf worker isolate 10' TaxID=2887348 RepID=UPI003D6E1C6B
MEYNQPERIIEGTQFVVDINTFQLQEKSDPNNRILFSDMKETKEGYEFEYCRDDKNIPFFFHSDNSVMVQLPPLVVLDPEGMARKHHLSVEDLKGKTDFDLLVDPVAFNKRMAWGMLPTIDIAGHTFYVDLRMDMLRPKDDFLSKGIVFSEVEGYYIEDKEKYIIPYNPKTREFQEPNYNTITTIPKDLIAIEIPNERNLDPIGWNRKMGLDLKTGLQWIGVKDHHTAGIVPWENTPLREIIEANLLRKENKELKETPLSPKPKVIKENREGENKQAENKSVQPSDPEREQGRRKGRKM